MRPHPWRAAFALTQVLYLGACSESRTVTIDLRSARFRCSIDNSDLARRNTLIYGSQQTPGSNTPRYIPTDIIFDLFTVPTEVLTEGCTVSLLRDHCIDGSCKLIGRTCIHASADTFRTATELLSTGGPSPSLHDLIPTEELDVFWKNLNNEAYLVRATVTSDLSVCETPRSFQCDAEGGDTTLQGVFFATIPAGSTDLLAEFSPSSCPSPDRTCASLMAVSASYPENARGCEP